MKWGKLNRLNWMEGIKIKGWLVYFCLSKFCPFKKDFVPANEKDLRNWEKESSPSVCMSVCPGEQENKREFV